MKEVRFFYAPDAARVTELPIDESGHAVRVLRLQSGDELVLTDGKGFFYNARLTIADAKRCRYVVENAVQQPREWKGWLHLAVAPTKNMDRMEWLAEKATEIGFDELTFLSCAFSERKIVKEERISKIVVSAMKQSHKAWLPRLNPLVSFTRFIETPFNGRKFIAHCYEDSDIGIGAMARRKKFLLDVLVPGENSLVLIGPEGDFSIDEVRQAVSRGYEPVTLGHSRLRTETAALVAVHLMHLANRM